MSNNTEAETITESHNIKGYLATDPYIQNPRRGMRKKMPNRKFTTDYVK